MKLEEQLLPHEDLAPLYETAVWLYVYRTFTRDEADRAAERIAIRFGVTSWPQLLLVDPLTLAVTQHAGRSVASFARAFAAARLPEKPDAERAEDARRRLGEAEDLARALENAVEVDLACAALLAPRVTDLVARTRALEVVAARRPAWIPPRAKALLAEPNDPFRFLVCQTLAAHPDPAANDALEALVERPEPSLNPNVLRIRAVQALAASGDAGSVAVIAPHAASGVYFNGLTGVAVDALAAIARRDPDAAAAVRAALSRAYPQPPEDGEGRALAACVALARRVHAALGSEVPFPEPYDEEARAALVAAAR